VFVNPFGGKRQARRTWTKLAEPILTAAGVACDLVETQYQVGAAEAHCS
jgi:diacylglycerol kinase family enzyme